DIAEIDRGTGKDLLLNANVQLDGLDSAGLEGFDGLSITDQEVDLSGLYKIGPAVTQAQKALIRFNEQAGLIIKEGIANTFSNLGQSIGDALAQGTNVLDAVGKSLLASLGGILVQLGEM